MAEPSLFNPAALNPDYDALILLESADRRGHVRAGAAPTLEEAVATLRALEGDAAEE